MVWEDTQVKFRIIEKYYLIIVDFFNKLKGLHNSNSEIDIQTCMMVGLNSIHRVFQFVLMKTKNIEKSFYYSQRTYVYYIEYINQIYETNLQNTLNHSDAVLFIYKKTIFEFQNSDNNKLFDTITNIMTFEEEITNLNDSDYYDWLTKLTNMIHIFFYWKNTSFSFDDRYYLMNNYLKQYLLHINEMDNAMKYLEILHEKIYMNYNTYKELLLELLEFHSASNSELINRIDQEEFFLKFHIEESILHENLENNNMKGLVKWIYKPLFNY